MVLFRLPVIVGAQLAPCRPGNQSKMNMEVALNTAIVQAVELWNPTGIQLKKGVRYRFAVPAGQVWKDGWIRCGPEGYWRWYLAPFQQHRRVPQANWFALIGTIGQSEANPILIGAGLSAYEPNQDGELFCFANDAPFAYNNNSGSIILEVYPT